MVKNFETLVYANRPDRLLPPSSYITPWDPEYLEFVDQLNLKHLVLPEKTIPPANGVISLPDILAVFGAQTLRQIARGDLHGFTSGEIDPRDFIMAGQYIMSLNRAEQIMTDMLTNKGAYLLVVSGAMGSSKSSLGAGLNKICEASSELEFIAYALSSEQKRYEAGDGQVGTASTMTFPAEVFTGSEGVNDRVAEINEEGKKAVLFLTEFMFLFFEDGEINKEKVDSFLTDLSSQDVMVVVDILNCFATGYTSPAVETLLEVLNENALFEGRKHASIHWSKCSFRRDQMAANVSPVEWAVGANLVRPRRPSEPVVQVLRTASFQGKNPGDVGLYPASALAWDFNANLCGEGPVSLDSLHLIEAMRANGIQVDLPILDIFPDMETRQYFAYQHLGLPGTIQEQKRVLSSLI